MNFFVAALMGLLHGVAEIFPISGSGHNSVLQNLFLLGEGESNRFFYGAMLPLATLISLCIYYRKEIKEMLTEFIGFFYEMRHPKPFDGEPKPARRQVFLILVSLIPLIIVLPLQSFTSKLYYNTLFVGFAFLIDGVLLYYADQLYSGKKTSHSVTVKDSLLIGVAQALATIPGISRPGFTITAGLSLGLDRSYAVKFSFLMSIPTLFVAGIYNLFKAIGDIANSRLFFVYLIGMIVAVIMGYFSIMIVNILAEKGKLFNMRYYCFAIGIITIVLSFII